MTYSRYNPNRNKRIKSPHQETATKWGEQKDEHDLAGKGSLHVSNARLSKSFWAEALANTCHLINKLPSSAIGGKTPLEV